MNNYTIYKSTNTINGKCYIGFDSKWPKRINAHINSAMNENSCEYDYVFHRAIRKYGKDTFQWEIIYQSYDRDYTLKEMEPHFIKENNSFKEWENGGYNMTLGGDGIFGVSRKGHNKGIKYPSRKKSGPLSEEHKKKLSLSKLGKPRPRHVIEAMKLGRLGKKDSDETREKKRLSLIGRKHSEKTKLKMRQSRYNYIKSVS